jgi:heterodisulfide reductase subunit A
MHAAYSKEADKVSLKDKTVVVIGGGITGTSVALDLARAGVRVELVEKDDFIGGHAAQLACKAVDDCQSCNVCLAEPRLRELLQHPNIKIRRRSQVRQVTPHTPGFALSLEERPAYIDPNSCTGCGLCLERCPEEGSLRRPSLPADLPHLAVDPEHCLYFRDQQSTMCRDVCPEEAIDFNQSTMQHQLNADAIILATGFMPYPAHEKIRLGYGRIPDVLTAMDLEELLRTTSRPNRPSDGSLPGKVAFIQCVGSRDVNSNNYCSRVCCGYALRLGRMLKHRFDIKVDVFYMDLQSFGHVYDDFLAKAKEELNLIRAMPYDVWPGHEGGVEIEYQAESGEGLRREPFDLLVLSVGMKPAVDHPDLARVLGLELDKHGFLSKDSKGIFTAGAAARPMDVAECVAQAGRAANLAINYLEEA